MPKSRIYEIAQELNKTNKEVIEFLKEKKVEVKSHMSTLEEKDEKMVRDAFTGKNEGKEEKTHFHDHRGSADSCHGASHGGFCGFYVLGGNRKQRDRGDI